MERAIEQGTADPVLGAEAKVLVDTHADVVTVEPVGQVAMFQQDTLQCDRHGAFATTGQPGKPDGRTALTQDAVAILP